MNCSCLAYGYSAAAAAAAAAAGCRLQAAVQAAAAVTPPVIGEAADIFVCKCLGPYDQTWRLA